MAMNWFEENAPNMDNVGPGGRQEETPSAPTQSVASVGQKAYTQENPYPLAGQPVPNAPGFVYNWAGGMEPGGPAPVNAVPTTTATPATTSTPATGDRQSQVMAIVQKYPHTPAGLKQAEAEIKAAFPKATIMGSKGDKIDFGDGEVVDMIISAGTGGTGWSWQSNKNAAAPGAMGSVASVGPQTTASGYQTGIGNFDGWSSEFTPTVGEAPVYQPLSPWSLTDLSAAKQFTYDPLKTPENFVGPTAETFTADPGYQFRLKQGIGAIENSNAAKGALHTPNVLRGINDYAQDFASNEFGNVWNREFNVWNGNNQTNMAAQAQQFGQGMNAAQFNEGNRQGIYGINNQNSIAQRADATNQNTNQQNSIWNAYNTNYANARDRYLMAYDTFRNNQNDNFDRNYKTATIGAGAS